MKKAIESANEFLSLAGDADPSRPIWVGHRMLGTGLTMLGDPAAARSHFEKVLESYDSQQHAQLAYSHAHDPRVTSLAGLAIGAWLLGYPDRALQQLDRCLSEAKGSLHFTSKAIGHVWAAILLSLAGLDRDAEKEARILREAAKEHSSAFWATPATILLGSVQARCGDVDAGLEEIRAGLATWRTIGARQFEPYFSCLEADACLRSGQPDAALAALAHARKTVAQTEQYVFEPEVLRWCGETQRARGGAERESEMAYLEGIESARRMGAKSFELRATTGLARLWRDQGKRSEARDLLAPVYGWFTEGFGTAELEDAKALLDTLAGG
jgi:predicted ATPase